MAGSEKRVLSREQFLISIDVRWDGRRRQSEQRRPYAKSFRVGLEMLSRLQIEK